MAHPTGPSPRPTALSPEVQVKILRAMRLGSFIRVACEASGISYAGFRNWQKRWEEGDPVAEKFADFFEELKRASANAELDSLEIIKEGAQNWQSNAWFLERRFYKKWAKKEHDPKPAEDPSTMTDERIEKRFKELKGSGT